MGNIYVEKIRSDNLVKMVWNVESKLGELNNQRYQISFGSQSEIRGKLQDIMNEIDFNNVNYINDYGHYWCGILTAEPFNEIEAKFDGSEEGILNAIKEHHLTVVDGGCQGMFIEFVPNSKSPLYHFFRKYAEDAYGGNITYSIQGLVNCIVKKMKRKLESNPDNYGTWQEEMYCPSCEMWTFGDKHNRCECGTELLNDVLDDGHLG